LGASLWVTLSISIFPKRIYTIYKKWIEKAVSIKDSIAIGKDFHFNRWRKTKKRESNSFQSLAQKICGYFV